VGDSHELARAVKKKLRSVIKNRMCFCFSLSFLLSPVARIRGYLRHSRAKNGQHGLLASRRRALIAFFPANGANERE
jgi:hypothetical protein